VFSACIQHADLELASGEQLASAVSANVELDGITTILLLTDEHHFNAVAAITLAGASSTPVYRLAASPDALAPNIPGDTLFSPRRHPLRPALDRPCSPPATPPGLASPPNRPAVPSPPATDLLFLIDPKGTLTPVTASSPPKPKPGDTLVLIGPNGEGPPQ
jgi:hypothetical protein